MKNSWDVYRVHIKGFAPFDMTFGPHPMNSALRERINGKREPETTEIFKAAVGSGDMVIEGGGCYGYMTMQLSQLVGPTGRVVCLEPSTKYNPLLSWNLARNKVENVEVWDTLLFNDKVFKRERGIGGTPQTLARLYKLAAIKPDVIFFDIEGYEIGALWRALRDGLFEHHRPTIIFQPHYIDYKRNYAPETYEKLWKALTVEGYSLHRLEYLIVCLPEEPDHAQRPAIHKLLHGGLQRTGTKTPKATPEVQPPVQDSEG